LIIAISLYSTSIAPESFKKYSIENSLLFDKPVLFGWANHLPEYLFDDAPASNERRQNIKLALMKAEIYSSAHTIDTLNNEIAVRSVAEEKMRYKKNYWSRENKN